MKNVMKFLPAMAIVLGAGLAVGAQSPAPKVKNVQSQVWYRTAADDKQPGTWHQGAPSEGCDSSELLCSGEFPDGYNPNDYDNNTNAAHNLSTTVETGFIQE